jgi:3-hydroxyacyl-[acyl-carrier-protein] dehydratase
MSDPRSQQSNFERALSFLPHGPEFRFLDELLDLNPGISAIATYKVRGDEPFLRGHFPGNPLFPGVLLVEAAAQLAGVTAQTDPHHAPLQGLKLTAIRAAKILGTANPGQLLRIKSTVTGRLSNLIQAEVSIQIDDNIVLTSSLTLSGEKL